MPNCTEFHFLWNGLRWLFLLICFFCSCFATDNEESPLTFAGISLELPGKDLAFVAKGQSLSVTCSQSPLLAKDARLMWIRTEQTEPFIERAKLDFVAVDESDSGEYKCFSERHKEWPNRTLHVFVASDEVHMVGPELIQDDDKVMSLSCQLEAQPDKKATWFHNGDPITEDRKHKFAVNNTLTVKFLSPIDSGVYMCRFDFENRNPAYSFHKVKAKGYVAHHKRQSSVNLVEGQSAFVRCEAYGFPAPTVQWFRDSEPLGNASGRVHLSAWRSVPNASLELRGAEFGDRAEYSCNASNVFGATDRVTLVRIKGRLAALWPLLGIIAEVVLLVAIVYFFEWKSSKKRALDDEAEQYEERQRLRDVNEESEMRRRTIKT